VVKDQLQGDGVQRVLEPDGGGRISELEGAAAVTPPRVELVAALRVD
jgi:hypothetical protein